MLKISDLKKNFDRLEAVKSFSLFVEKGQTTVLIGPSGCGKSTILRMIIGLIPPDAGEIQFDGEHVTSESVISLRRKMGYVIQDGGLFPHLTTRQNISLMATYLGWSQSKIAERVTELIDLTQFPADGLDRYPAQLSGGQKQRVSLMRALMLDPILLLMDEPLGALDPLIRIDLQAELKSIFQKLHKTVVFVTHDLGEAGFIGDTIVLLRDGQLVQEGSLNELVNSPADPFVTRFINAQRSPLEKIQGAQG